MGDKFKDRYRIESARLQNWDYGWNALYFVTICTGGRECYFGDVINGSMKYSQIGILADKLWLEIPNQFYDAKLDEYKIMPNHIHAIIQIDKQDSYIENNLNGNIHMDTCKDAINRVSTMQESNTDSISEKGSKIGSDQQKGGITGNKNPMLHDNLSRIIRWYKGRMSYQTRKANVDFYWQSRFHDHIIRDEESLHNIRRYIKENPKKWVVDQLNPENDTDDKK